jgi:hypothetical protein
MSLHGHPYRRELVRATGISIERRHVALRVGGLTLADRYGKQQPTKD